MSQARRGLQAALLVAVPASVLASAAVYRVAADPARSARTHHGNALPGRQPSVRDAIDAFLRQRANDPSSVTVQSVLYGSADYGGDLVPLARIQFREKNSFGAMVFRDIIVRIDGREISRGPYEENFEGMADRMSWSP